MMLPNARVDFSDPTDGTGERVLTVLVEIYPAARDARLLDWAAEFDWAVAWPSQLTYPDGTPIGTNHLLAWTALGVASDGTPRSVILRRVRHTYGPLQISTAYFREMDR